jgi:hypothetical protein
MKLDPAFAWMQKRAWWILAALAFVASFFVRQLVCDYSQYHGYKECARHSIANIVWDWIDVHSGVAVAIATAFIAWFTFTLMRVSKRQGEQIDREFLASHRPHIGVRPRLQGLRSGNTKDGWVVEATIPYQLVNVGDSPATIVTVQVCHVARWEDEPIIYTDGPVSIPARTTPLAEGERTEEVYEGKSTRQVSPQTESFRRGPTELIFFGVVVYKDRNNRIRERGFCRVYIIADNNVNNWATIHDPQREYDD